MHSVPAIYAAASGGTGSLTTAWSNFESAVNSAFPNLFKWMAIAGVVIIIMGAGKYALDKRRGGANSQNLLWSIIAGGLLASPALLVPIILKIADMIINLIANIAGK